MTSPSFAHLRAHSEYCITESTLRLDELIALAAQDGQGSIAVTDIDSLFGAVRFYTKARAAGLKPILGVDIGIFQPGRETRNRILLLAKNHQGYLNLLHLLTQAHRRENGHVAVELDMEWLSTKNEGLYCLLGGANSAVALLTQSAGEPTTDLAHAALAHIETLRLIFGPHFFFELQRPGRLDDDKIIAATLRLSDDMGVPITCTHPMQFASKNDYLSHELRVCDKRGEILHDRNRPRSYTPHQHFLTQMEMAALFSDVPDALSNALAIAESCNLSIPLGKSVLPNFETPMGQTLGEALRQASQRGLDARLAVLYPDPALRAVKLEAYQNRLNMELAVISSMGFEGYFMIVQDFIGWAKLNSIPVGPGRGSGAGSLVAYSLEITDLDPLEYNLLFERFLNPERVSMPDFDIDFCKIKREKVIEYVTNKYGKNAVSGIANINTLQARAAIKAAGRALGMRVPFVGSVSNLIPALPGQDVTIQSAMCSEAALSLRVKQEPEVARLLKMAQALEGLPTAIGQHAAGLVISPTVISDYAPLYLPENKAQAVTQYDKDDIEQAGLVKFDFLGLKTLTEIQLAVDFIKLRAGQETFDITRIPLDDPAVYEVFQKGDTHCIFQFESAGMQRLLVEANPSCFGDLVALNALYRPGPMDLIPEFIKRKSGQQAVGYLDDRLTPILSETYGIMVYQEQVMQIAQTIGGYTLGGADLLRRAMGKKKIEEMAKHRRVFIDGAVLKNVSEESAGILFDMMEKFAGYGFNKSHAAAYTLLAYQTAYLKRYFPSAFYASWLSTESEEDTEIIPPLIKDAKNHGIFVLPPCINKSTLQFEIELGNDNLRYGFAGLKGLGLETADSILHERQANGPYTSLRGLVARLGAKANKKTLDVLAKSGALDTWGLDRGEILTAIPLEMKYNKERLKYEGKQHSAPAASKKGQEPTPPPWPTGSSQPLLQMLAGERDAFGFFFSKHPYQHYASLLGGLKACESLESIAQRPIDWDQHLIAGVVSDCRLIDTRSGKLLIATIGDGTIEVEVKGFSTVANRIGEWFKKDAFALMAVNLREDRMRGGKSIQITDAQPLARASVLLAESLNLLADPSELSSILTMAHAYPGNFPLYVWHPACSALARSCAPYAYIQQTQECFDAFAQKHHEFCAISHQQGKPRALLS